MLADLKEFQAFQRRTKENTPRRMFLFTKRGLKDDSLIFFPSRFVLFSSDHEPQREAKRERENTFFQQKKA